MSTDAKRKNDLIVSLGPGKNVLMPDIYAEEYAVDDSVLELVDKPAKQTDESSGFDPYDTATLYIEK